MRASCSLSFYMRNGSTPQASTRVSNCTPSAKTSPVLDPSVGSGSYLIKLHGILFKTSNHTELAKFIRGSIKSIYTMVSFLSSKSQRWEEAGKISRNPHTAMMALLVCLIKPLLVHFPVWWHWQKWFPSGFGTRPLMKH